MRPNYNPEGIFDENKMSSGPNERTNSITQLWHMNGKCSEGTIPVRRTKKEDVLRASSVKRYGKKKHKSIPKPRSADPDLINQSGHQVSNQEHCLLYLLMFMDWFSCLFWSIDSMPLHMSKERSIMEQKRLLMFGSLRYNSLMSSACLRFGS